MAEVTKADTLLLHGSSTSSTTRLVQGVRFRFACYGAVYVERNCKRRQGDRPRPEILHSAMLSIVAPCHNGKEGLTTVSSTVAIIIWDSAWAGSQGASSPYLLALEVAKLASHCYWRPLAPCVSEGCRLCVVLFSMYSTRPAAPLMQSRLGGDCCALVRIFLRLNVAWSGKTSRILLIETRTLSRAVVNYGQAGVAVTCICWQA